MNVLIIEDDPDICHLYSIWLQESNYNYVITNNVEDGLYEYHKSLQQQKQENSDNFSNSFDLIILDYDLASKNNSDTTKNGLNVAKEILSLNKDQRIIFASAYVKETLEESIKCLKHVVELMQKPFSLKELVNTVEDNKIYQELQKFNIDIDLVKALSPTHAQIMELLDKVRKTTTTRII